MKLYMIPPSGNAFKVELLLSLLNVPFEKIIVDLKHEHTRLAFLKISPRGQVPAIEEDGQTIWDSAACLVYIARKYGGEQWLPLDPAEMATIMQWIALAANEIQFGLQYARRDIRNKIGTPETRQLHEAAGRVALTTLETQLKTNDWLALGRPTIADVACFPYVSSAPEGEIPLDPYPGIIAWLARCEGLPQWLSR